MQHRQRGMTMLGIIVVVIVVGAWLYAGIRLAPKYLEYMRVASTLEKVRDEFDSNPGSTEFMLRKAVERHFDIDMVEVITSNDIEINKEGGTSYFRACRYVRCSCPLLVCPKRRFLSSAPSVCSSVPSQARK